MVKIKPLALALGALIALSACSAGGAQSGAPASGAASADSAASSEAPASANGAASADSAPSAASADAPASAPAGPYTFTDDNGATVEFKAQPTKIVSTSVTLTGTLLAIDAKVIGSGGSKPDGPGLDSNGWFKHWAPTATERGVQSLYTNQKVDLEAIMAAQPDLIIVSKTGGDSAMDQYEQLKGIAPTVVIDYNSTDWRTATQRVAEAVGAPQKAEKLLADFDVKVAETKAAIKAPAQPVNIAVYDAQKGLSVGMPTAPQALVLKDLGITVQDTGVAPEEGRKDFAFTSPEQALQALKQDILLLVGNDDANKDALLADANFAQLPAVQSKKVYALGEASFKLDYFAAVDLVDHVKKAFAQ
ncbi:MAG: Fe2+-enterobactin ABC transporter substrate-binding protein [Actinomycetaceae bacterium]|nr:Fe2+-enterobactin ABC transporter substrate-binding protein [Actinomycetaceae bacterium]